MTDTPLNPGDVAAIGTPGTVEHICPHCGGAGRIGNGNCPSCDGSGKIIDSIGGA